MMKILGIRKVVETDPQEFELRFQDTENTKPGYRHTTESGTEPELRALLTEAGMSEPTINGLFKQAA